MLYKNLISNLIQLAESYPQIGTVEFGEINNFFSHNKVFSFILFQPGLTELFTGINKNINRHNLIMFIGDQLEKGGSNSLNILNSNLEIINKFLVDLSLVSGDLILLRDSITIEHDFYSQDEECFVSIVRFALETTNSTTDPC